MLLSGKPRTTITLNCPCCPRPQSLMLVCKAANRTI